MGSMENFIHTENLKLLKKQLEASTDDAQRKALTRLLAKEEAKGEQVVAKSKQPS